MGNICNNCLKDTSDCIKGFVHSSYDGIRDDDEFDDFPLNDPISSPVINKNVIKWDNKMNNLSSSSSNTNNSTKQSSNTQKVLINQSNSKSSSTNYLNSRNSNNKFNTFSPPKPGFFIKYDLKDVIGVGSTATCHRCIRKSDGAEFACKVIDKRQVEVKFAGLLDQFYVEIRVLQLMDHPNIINLEDVFETPDRIYMVMELMQGGELFDYVVEKGTLSEEEASILVRKLTSAVAHMHDQNVIHRDLKPENLLLTSRQSNTAQVKLIDFGLAKIISDSAPISSFLGTRGYLAPEMLQRHSYDKAIDIWALGVIVFVLLCGCLPFDDDSSMINSDADARKKFTLRFPRWAMSLSKSAKDLLQCLLDVNPKTRFTAHQALQHPWVTGEGVASNNYLASPSMISQRRQELKSPKTTRIIQNGGSNIHNGQYKDGSISTRPRKNSF